MRGMFSRLCSTLRDPVLHAHVRHCLAVGCHWLWRNRIPVLALILIGVLLDLLYRGRLEGETVILAIVGPLMTWFAWQKTRNEKTSNDQRHGDHDRIHEIVLQEITAIKGNGGGGLPPFFAGPVPPPAELPKV